MFRYNPKANYQPNGGRYLQILSGKDLYKQTIVVSAMENDTFSARFPNIFVDYPLGQMHVGDKVWMNWNKAPLKLWQTQLNFAVFCALSACGVSSAHLNYTKHPMIRSIYRFHVYYHVRILKKLQVPPPHETGFNAADNPYTESEFLKICEDYGVPNDPMRYRDEKFYWTYHCGVSCLDDYIGPDSMTRWIIEKSVGFTDVGLLRISESMRAYAFLILSSQASARSSIVGNTASALTAQSAFLNNFEDIVNRRVNIQEDIKRYQDTLSYTSSKVNYSVGESIYMLPNDMKLKIRPGTLNYNNKILISDEKFILGKNEKVNSSERPIIKSHKGSNIVTQTAVTHKDSNHVKQTAVTHKDSETAVTHEDLEKKPTITHKEEKIALILSLTGIFTVWYLFQ